MTQVPFKKFSKRFNPYSKITNQSNIVCRFWVKGVCTKGNTCEYKHSYDSTQVIECYFFKTTGKCNNPRCTYLHPDKEKVMNPDEKPVEVKSCPDFDKGFCLAGQACKYRHFQKLICTNYLTGFCPYGSHCKQVHFDGYFDEEEKDDGMAVSDKTVEEAPKSSADESNETEKSQETETSEETETGEEIEMSEGTETSEEPEKSEVTETNEETETSEETKKSEGTETSEEPEKSEGTETSEETEKSE